MTIPSHQNLKKFQFGSKLSLASTLVGGVCVLWGVNYTFFKHSELPLCNQDLLAGATEEHLFEEQSLVVAIDGAVKSPGVYQVPIGSRLELLIDQAGGLARNADREYLAHQLNLSKKLVDGEKAYIPFVGEQNEVFSGVHEDDSGKAKISINSASLEELDSLPGVGVNRGTEIIENRPYADINELVSKKILSENLFTSIKGEIAL